MKVKDELLEILSEGRERGGGRGNISKEKIEESGRREGLRAWCGDVYNVDRQVVWLLGFSVI